MPAPPPRVHCSNMISPSDSRRRLNLIPRRIVCLWYAFTAFTLSACGALLWAGPAHGSALPAPVALGSGWKLQDIAVAPQAGAAISRPGFGTSGWYPATVPGTVLTTLVNNGVYPEPLYGENNRPNRIPERLCRTSYWYRTEQPIPAGYAGRRIWLNFDGINYTAEVWVNGTKAGDIRGAFVRGAFDVTELVRPGEIAAIAVLLQPPPHPGDPEEQTIAAGVGKNGGVLSKDGPTFICTQGWDWIPAIRDRDIGIWQKVWFSASGAAVIENPYVTAHLPLPRTDSADLTFETTVRNLTNVPVQGVLHGAFEDVEFSVPVQIDAASARLVKLTPRDIPQLRVSHPRLWWPNGYGQPNLYELHVAFTTAEGTSDAHDLNFGIREIGYHVPGSENLTLSVNGVPVMCRGGDWGMDEAMKRIPRARLEAQIRYHQLARCNMIRNWVGQSTSEDFYDLCDRYGIMVWDECFQPNPSDSGRTNRDDGSQDIADVPMYLANVRDKVLRFRSHASIVLWCGRNEGDPSPQAVADGVKAIMTELDPLRLYHPNSADGRGVRSGGPYRWRTPREYYLPPPPPSGKPDTRRPEDLEPFKTEIGSVSVPTLESVQAMMPEKDWDTINDDWAEHDLARGAQAGDQYPVVLAQRYGPFQRLPEFVRAAQMANYEAFRAMYEGRFARLFAPCTGVLTWMSNPSQPSFVWQLYSYDLEPLAALFAVRKACEPLHVMLNQHDLHLNVINQLPVDAATLRARVRLFNLDGTVKLDRTIPASARRSAATDLGPINFPPDISPVHFVSLELMDPAERLVSDNLYWCGSASAPDDFRALDTMPLVTLNARVMRHDSAGHCRVTVTLVNPTRTVALLAHVQLRRARSGVRVLPVSYDDNYMSLVPGGSRTIEVDASANDLQGEDPLLVVDGWNVTTPEQTFPGNVHVGPNGRRTRP